MGLSQRVSELMIVFEPAEEDHKTPLILKLGCERCSAITSDIFAFEIIYLIKSLWYNQISEKLANLFTHLQPIWGIWNYKLLVWLDVKINEINMDDDDAIRY